MHLQYDFVAFLFLSTIITGTVLLVDRFVLIKKRSYFRDKDSNRHILVEFCEWFFPIFFTVCILRAFLLEPYRIPTGSMKPTLFEREFILVNKLAYSIKLPLFDNVLLKTGEASYGDVVLFRYPVDKSTVYIKRVVALPGDKVTYKNKSLYINGKRQNKSFIDREVDKDLTTGSAWLVKRYEEELSNYKHDIYINGYHEKDMAEVVVPEGHYFVMGDNRGNSKDSRVFGFVSHDLLLGRAFKIFYSHNDKFYDYNGDRIGINL